MVATAEPYVGKYFSQDYVRRKILRQTDVEILEQDALIDKEIKDGIISDPNAPIEQDFATPGVQQSTSQMDLGRPIMEPDLESQATKSTQLPKGGEI
jgi:hypothetical protein